MGQIGSGGTAPMAAGIVIDLVGMLGAGADYPIYKRLMANAKKKYAFEIVELAKEISE